MKKETKFRGKSKKSKKWVYGYYVKEYDCIEDKIFHKIYETTENEEEEGIVEIIPKTLSQFTNYQDKNNKDIYLNATVREWLEDKVEEEGGYWWYGIVKEVNGCKVVLQRGFDYSHSKFPDDYTFLYEEAPVCEVVDNPEP